MASDMVMVQAVIIASPARFSFALRVAYDHLHLILQEPP